MYCTKSYLTIYKIYVLSEFILKKYFLYLKDFNLLTLLHSHLFTFVSYFCMKGANIIMIYNENTGRITVFSIKVAHKPYQT